jgi:hypothetical protein
VIANTRQGPYDGVEDTYVGVVNTSGMTLPFIKLTGPFGTFTQFDGDGLQPFGSPAPTTGLPLSYFLTGYEGPDNYFSNIYFGNNFTETARVNFIGGLANGQETWFSVEFVPSASSLIATCPTAPLSQGYWRNHPDAWPVYGLAIGGIFYTKSQVLTVLNTPTQGDAALILADQLIATELNIDNGAPDSGTTNAKIASANDLLTGINLLSHTRVSPSSSLGQMMLALATYLEGFNNNLYT